MGYAGERINDEKEAKRQRRGALKGPGKKLQKKRNFGNYSLAIDRMG